MSPVQMSASSSEEGLKRLRTSAPPARIAIYSLDKLGFGAGFLSLVQAIVFTFVVYFGRLDCFVPDEYRHQARYIENWCANENVNVIPIANFLLLQSVLILLPLFVFYGLVGQTIANVVASVKIHMYELSKASVESARKRLQDTDRENSEASVAEDQLMRADEGNVNSVPDSGPLLSVPKFLDHSRFGLAYADQVSEEIFNQAPRVDENHHARMACIEKKSVGLYRLAKKQNPIGLFELAAPLARRNTATYNRYWWSIYFAVVVLIPICFQIWFQYASALNYQVNNAFPTNLPSSSSNVISCSNVPLLVEPAPNPNSSLPFNLVCVYTAAQYLQTAWIYNYLVVTAYSVVCVVRLGWSLTSMNDDERMLEAACLQSMPAADLAFPTSGMAFIRKHQPKVSRWRERRWEEGLQRAEQRREERKNNGSARNIQHQGSSADGQLRSRLLPNEPTTV